MAVQSWRGLTIHSNPCDELARELEEILRADWTAQIIEDADSSRGTESLPFDERLRRLGACDDHRNQQGGQA